MLAARPVVFTETCRVVLVLPVVGATESHVPLGLGAAVKAMVPLAPFTVRVCDAGLAPPTMPLKVSGVGVTVSTG